MKVVALVSGGKDSCYNMMECVRHGHEIVALGNLHPPAGSPDELDSHMFQTVGHQIIEYIAKAMELPLYRQPLDGGSIQQDLHFTSAPTADRDEVEDLEQLLRTIKEAHPEVNAVSCGAILSNYQRSRVEHVCQRLGLASLTYLWQRDQAELLQEMLDARVHAVLVKVASLGLTSRHLTQSLSALQPQLTAAAAQCGLNVCGEGGEYETLVLDCPLFHRRLVVSEWRMEGELRDTMAPVAHATPAAVHLEDKPDADVQADQRAMQPYPRPAPRESLAGASGDAEWAAALPALDVTVAGDAPAASTQPTWSARPDAKLRFASSASATALASLSGPAAVAAAEDLAQLLPALRPDGFRPAYVDLVIPDMTQFGAVNARYLATMPPVGPPARACVQGAPLTAPGGDRVGVVADMVSFRVPADGSLGSADAAYLHVQSISRWAPANIGPYAQGWAVGGVAMLAGQIGLAPGHMEFESRVADEVFRSFRNAHHGVEGLACNRRALTSAAVFLSAQSLQSRAFLLALAELARRTAVSGAPTEADCASATTADLGERVFAVFPALCTRMLSARPTPVPAPAAEDEDEEEEDEEDVRYDAEPALARAAYAMGLAPPILTAPADSALAAAAPVSVLAVPVLPRAAHSEVQVIAATDAALARADAAGVGARKLRWAVTRELEGVLVTVVVACAGVPGFLADLTAYVLAPRQLPAAAAAAALSLADDLLHDAALAMGLTADYAAPTAPRFLAAASLPASAAPADVVRARLVCSSATPTPSILAAVPAGSPLAHASVTPVFAMRPNLHAARAEAAVFFQDAARRADQAAAAADPDNQASLPRPTPRWKPAPECLCGKMASCPLGLTAGHLGLPHVHAQEAALAECFAVVQLVLANIDNKE